MTIKCGRDERFANLIKALQRIFKVDFPSDMELVYYAEAEIETFLSVYGAITPLIHKLHRIIKSYTLVWTCPINSLQSVRMKRDCRLLPFQLLQDFPPQEMEYGTSGIIFPDPDSVTIVVFGKPGPGKTIWPPPEIKEEEIQFDDPEDWELN